MGKTKGVSRAYTAPLQSLPEEAGTRQLVHVPEKKTGECGPLDFQWVRYRPTKPGAGFSGTEEGGSPKLTGTERRRRRLALGMDKRNLPL